MSCCLPVPQYKVSVCLLLLASFVSSALTAYKLFPSVCVSVLLALPDLLSAFGFLPFCLPILLLLPRLLTTCVLTLAVDKGLVLFLV